MVGTAGEIKYTYAPDDESELIKLSNMLLIDDRDGKPQGINLFSGRGPYAAFGNSTGDKEMFEYTQSFGGKRLMMLVHQDDTEREYSYGPGSKFGTLAKLSWPNQDVISIERGWKIIFP